MGDTNSRARVAGAVAYGVQGLCFAALVTRIPTIQERFDLTETSLALLLGVVPIVAGIGSIVAGMAIARIGSIVHYLDAGGVLVAEALGVEAVLAGLREITTNDDQLSSEAGRIFDGLYQNYQPENLHE